MDRCNSQKTTAAKGGFAAIIFNMQNLGVKSYPIYCIVIVLTIHQLNIYHRIFCI